MNRVTVLIAAFACLFPSSVFAQAATDEHQRLEGTWIPESAELSGQPFPDEGLKSMRLTMKSGKYTTHVGDVVDRGEYTLTVDAKPKAMEIAGGEGPNQGKKFPAIYEFIGDKLRICYDLSGKKRPAEFKTEKGSQHFLVTYQRQKP
jgi:uncharacterized protein (TIGR03067 family)